MKDADIKLIREVLEDERKQMHTLAETKDEGKLARAQEIDRIIDRVERACRIIENR